MATRKYTKSKAPNDGLPLIASDEIVNFLSNWKDSLVEDNFGWWLLDKVNGSVDDSWWLRVDANLLTMPRMPKYVRNNFDRIISHFGECWVEAEY